jgi:hypothetical protein
MLLLTRRAFVAGLATPLATVPRYARTAPNRALAGGHVMRDLAPRVDGDGSRGSLGTLWTLQHDKSTATCLLMSWLRVAEVRVLVKAVSGDTLLSQRCDRNEAFALAEQWKRRMLHRGWKPLSDLGSADNLDTC